MDNIQEAIQLLEHYKNFKKRQPEGSFLEFCHWMQATMDAQQKRLDFVDALPFAFPNASLEEAMGWIWGRLLKFTSIWEKKAFENQKLHSIDEFGLLMFIQAHPNCSKAEVAASSLMEKSTVYEIIKRLANRGLIEEETDAQDKRHKIIRLSTSGRENLFAAFERVKEVSYWLTRRLQQNEKEELMRLLIKLNTFHQKALEEHADKSWESIMRQ